MFSLALKNILFYRGRSITTFVLTFFSALMFIVYVALMDGSHGSMLKNALKVYTGAIEIYKKGYREEGGNDYLIEDVASVEKVLSKVEGISDYTSRYETYGLLSSKDRSTAAMVAGIEPQKERKLSELYSTLVSGEYLSENSGNCLYAGVDLVKKLQVKLGDEVSFVGSASDNSFAADLFKLCGTFRTGAFEFDSTAAFLSRSYFDELMYAKNKASYITIRLDDLNKVDAVNEEIIKHLDSQYESVTWKVLMKSMVQAMQVDSIFGYISIVLFFVVIFFVIMIFGFINVSSRVREFGTLRSIGLTRGKIRLLLFNEIFILSTTAILLATPIGAYIAYYFSLHPFVMEGISETYKDYGVVSDEIPLAFNLFTISWNVAVIYLLNFLSIIYPIRYINAFKPVEASHHV